MTGLVEYGTNVGVKPRLGGDQFPRLQFPRFQFLRRRLAGENGRPVSGPLT